MRQVYAPADAAEAHMLVHLLEQNGIQALIHGEALQGAVGELPAAGLLQLLVPDEEHDAARGVPDLAVYFRHGMVAREEISDLNSRQIVRINYYRGPLLESAEIDADRDGFLETRQTFGRFGEVTNTEARPRG